MLFDGHLDLAASAVYCERDLRLPLDAIRAREAGGTPDGRGVAMVTLPEMRAAGCRVAVTTMLARAKPWVEPTRQVRRYNLDWPDESMAHAAAHAELAYYRLLERQGHARIITGAAALDHCSTDTSAAAPLGLILMMEGADPITAPDEVHYWHAQGLRCLSLAHFGRSRYACGTPSPDPASFERDGPLTDLGRALLDAMAPLRIVLDLTHTADQSLAEALDRYAGPVCATHCNARALCDAPRQLTDAQARAIFARGGVIGVVGYGRFIADRPAKQQTLDDLARHVDHFCQLAGDARHVGIGSDLDGGFGAEATPAGLDRYADLPRLADALARLRFPDADIAHVLGGNWLAFWRAALRDHPVL